jgi:hypothetical protein
MMNNSYLCHHGVTGQKWGVRRYQNKDGSLTPEGRKRLFGAGSKNRQKFAENWEKYEEAKKVAVKDKSFKNNLNRQMYLNKANDYLNRTYQQARAQSMLRFDGQSLWALRRGNDWVDAFMEDYRKHGVD